MFVNVDIRTLILAIGFMIGFTYGNDCSSVTENKILITCPGDSKATKTYCCKIGGLRCCDEEEFANEEKNNVARNSLLDRFKRDYDTVGYDGLTSDGPGGGALAGMISALILPILCIACCCWCCSCCPCYRWCHPNAPMTSVTIIQPPSGYPCNPVSNNFNIQMPSNEAAEMPRPDDLPPRYTSSGYTKLSEGDGFGSNYIR